MHFFRNINASLKQKMRNKLQAKLAWVQVPNLDRRIKFLEGEQKGKGEMPLSLGEATDLMRIV